MKTLLGIIAVLALAAAGFFYLSSQRKDSSPSTSTINSPQSENGVDTQVIASNLEIPWEIEFLPDGTFFVTERKGIVWQFEGVNKKNILQLNEVAHIGEGGLLGLVNHPQHEKNGFTYLYYTYENGTKNKVVRYKHIHDSLEQDKIIIDNIPGNNNHNGGRIKFGPDGKLYITTGDSENPSTAQDKNSLAGKILRVNDDGTIPGDNPFGNAVYSYGHRNPQGLAWGHFGDLFATEHGQSAYDEINLVQKGNNYGWPEIRGDQEKAGMNKPLHHSGPDTWAPSGAVIVDGMKLYFAGLRGQAIYSIHIGPRTLEARIDEGPAVKEHFKSQFGRIRSITLGPDKMFYILTNNTDGRGKPQQGDDKLIKIDPKLFE